MTTLYDTLGASLDASLADIKRAYRRASAKAHPDKGGSDERQTEINKAYAILGDPAKRLKYDQTGQTDEELTDDQHAANVMKLLFIKIIEHCISEGNGGDPVVMLRAEIHKGLREAPGLLGAQRKKIAKLEKGLKRQLKGSKNRLPHLESALHGHIAIQHQTLMQMELAERIGPIMLDILKWYSWESDYDRYAQYGAQLGNIFLKNPGA